MKYMGSKARHAKEILDAIFSEADRVSAGRTSWVEPFVGGANMIDKVPKALKRYGNDINPYLVRLFQAVQKGWEPNDFYSEEMYQVAKNIAKITPSPSSLNEAAEIGFIAIGCSYSGKWFGGYARGNANNGTPRNYSLESKKNLLQQDIEGVVFTSGDYKLMTIPPKSIVYCDPPYAGTTKYKNEFDHPAFWEWCKAQSDNGHLVFVSEYKAPEGWKCIWEKKVNNSLTKETGSKQGVERLFTRIHEEP